MTKKKKNTKNNSTTKIKSEKHTKQKLKYTDISFSLLHKSDWVKFNERKLIISVLTFATLSHRNSSKRTLNWNIKATKKKKEPKASILLMASVTININVGVARTFFGSLKLMMARIKLKRFVTSNSDKNIVKEQIRNCNFRQSKTTSWGDTSNHKFP